MNNNIRLTKNTLLTIQIAFQNHFLKKDHLWLFGSRIDPCKLGGDIDLYIETLEPDISIALNRKANFINEIWKKLGEQKIDVILHLLLYPNDFPIYQIAKKTGVKLI